MAGRITTVFQKRTERPIDWTRLRISAIVSAEKFVGQPYPLLQENVVDTRKRNVTIVRIRRCLLELITVLILDMLLWNNKMFLYGL